MLKKKYLLRIEALITFFCGNNEDYIGQCCYKEHLLYGQIIAGYIVELCAAQ